MAKKIHIVSRSNNSFTHCGWLIKLGMRMLREIANPFSTGTPGMKISCKICLREEYKREKR